MGPFSSLSFYSHILLKGVFLVKDTMPLGPSGALSAPYQVSLHKLK